MTNAKQSMVAFGANLQLGSLSLEQTIFAAIKAFRDEDLDVISTSNLYETPSFPAGSGPNYINGALLITPRHFAQPQEILAALHRIEARFGRQRVQRWGGRTLDLDLIACDDTVLPDQATFQRWFDMPLAEQASRAPDQIIVPHPRMQDRAFVLVPLADVAPEWRHPVLQKTVTQLLADLPEAARREVVLRRSAASF